jgi:hypothetical protein
LDRVEAAADARNWSEVILLAEDILRIDPENNDAQTFLAGRA